MSLKEKTGIYSLGFNPSSLMGLLMPLLFVLVVGGVLGYFVTR